MVANVSKLLARYCCVTHIIQALLGTDLFNGSEWEMGQILEETGTCLIKPDLKADKREAIKLSRALQHVAYAVWFLSCNVLVKKLVMCVRRLIIYLSFSPVMDLIQAAFYTHLPAYDVCTKRITNYILNDAGHGEMVANMRIFSLRSFSRRSQYSLWRFKIKAAKAERVQALLVSLLNSLPLLLLFVQVLLHILTSRSCG